MCLCVSAARRSGSKCSPDGDLTRQNEIVGVLCGIWKHLVAVDMFSIQGMLGFGCGVRPIIAHK